MAQASPQMQAQTFPAWPPSYQGAYQQHGIPPPVPPTPVPQAAYAAIPPPAPPAYQPAAMYQPAQTYIPPIGGGEGGGMATILPGGHISSMVGDLQYPFVLAPRSELVRILNSY